jgi:hypothetical protein
MAARSEEGDRIGVEVEAVEEERLRVPSWFGEAVLLGQYWLESGLVSYLEAEVRVERGRMGRYEVGDFVLLLNSYAISGEKTLADFYKAIAPVKEVLMGLWGRSGCPSASSLSRFLAAVGTGAVGGLRELFERDLGRNGVGVMRGIGMFDRAEDHYMVIDVDGTVSAARQRSLVKDRLNYPSARRRSDAACAPGYKGRKRGEVSRTRSTIAVAQTSEWLGSYGGSGNGDVKGALEQACRVIKRYLEQRGLNVAHGLVRLDGLYGSASYLSIVQQAGLGYILRCRDYHLLKEPGIAQRLERAAVWEWQDIGGNSFSQIMDLGYVEALGRGYATPMRVIVLRTPEKLHQARIGKRLKKYVYELFMTSQSMGSLSVMDILSLYRGRGGFEQQLSQEDQEQDYDRWCSWHPEGQEFWQILGQWSWNWRVWMGWQQKQVVRQTVWSEGESEDERVLRMGWRGTLPPPVLPPSLQFMQERPEEAKPRESVPPLGELLAIREESGGEPAPTTPTVESAVPKGDKAKEYGAMEVSTEWGRVPQKGKRFGNEDFRIVDEQTVLCPAGHPMSERTSKENQNGDLRMQFGIQASLCQRCPVKRQCLSPQSKGVVGRRVTVIRRATSRAKGVVATRSAIVRSAFRWLMNPQLQYEQPLYWCDIAASELRRTWHEHLSQQEVEIKLSSRQEQRQAAAEAPLLSRAQREHRRLSWSERWERNERAAAAAGWMVVLYSGKAISAGMRDLSHRSFS